MKKGISFSCQHCGHVVPVFKSQMNSVDGDSTVATCSKCGLNITHNEVISRAQTGVERMKQEAETRTKAK
jgi:transcription elongation factor Elf1